MTKQVENAIYLLSDKRLERDELISRFIFHSRLCSGGKVKYAAFMPPKEHFDISMYRIQNLCEEEIWEIDDQFVSGLRGEKSLGRADLKVGIIIDQNLTIDPNGIPHHRHANVCFSEGMMKDNQKLIAMKLAEVAIFVPRNRDS